MILSRLAIGYTYEHKQALNSYIRAGKQTAIYVWLRVKVKVGLNIRQTLQYWHAANHGKCHIHKKLS